MEGPSYASPDMLDPAAPGVRESYALLCFYLVSQTGDQRRVSRDARTHDPGMSLFEGLAVLVRACSGMS